MSDWFTESDAEKAARALDPEAWAILDSDSIGMMTRRKVSIEQARAALRAVNPFEWREIETAPKNYAPIRLWSPHTHTYPFTGRYWPNDAWRDDEDGDICKPTHWLPLEFPPSPEGNK